MEVRFENEPFAAAIEKLSDMARKSGAEEFGYKGIAYSNLNTLNQNITLDLKDVPFGYVLNVICVINYLEFYTNNNFVIIQNKINKTFESIALTKPVINALKINNQITEDNIRNGLLALTIRLEEHDRIIISEQSSFAIIEIAKPEADTLHALLELINRGLVVNSGNQQP